MTAGREVEAKFYVRDLPRVAQSLHERGATLVQPRVHETNLRFDRPDGSLKAAGQVLRLRHDTQILLTFKGPTTHSGGVLSRDEIEMTVSNFEQARKMLDALGFIISARYEKFRTTFELNGLKVMLDELPYGDFVEIEGPDEVSVRRLATALGLNMEAAIPASYLALFERLCADRGLDPGQLTFEALGEMQATSEDLKIQAADS